jgi:hypothetical protein
MRKHLRKTNTEFETAEIAKPGQRFGRHQGGDKLVMGLKCLIQWNQDES